MKRESFILVIELYQDIKVGIKETLKVLVGNGLTMVGFDEGFLGKITRIESVVKNECHPSFLECDENDCTYYSVILDDPKLSNEEKADILMKPRKKM